MKSGAGTGRFNVSLAVGTIGRTMIATPGVPAERIKILREVISNVQGP